MWHRVPVSRRCLLFKIKLRIKLRIKIRARGFWRAFGLGARSTAGGGRPGTRTVPPQAHVSPPTRPGPSLQLVRSRFAGFSKVDPFHSLKVDRLMRAMR